eukprot:3699633-Prymnesium_polylepis.1
MLRGERSSDAACPDDRASWLACHASEERSRSRLQWTAATFFGPRRSQPRVFLAVVPRTRFDPVWVPERARGV